MIEEEERLKAAQRKAEGQQRGRDNRYLVGGDSPPTSFSGAGGKVRDIVAPAVGMTPTRYAHAKTVVVETQSKDPVVAQVARAAQERMDETGVVESAYRKVLAAKQGTPEVVPLRHVDNRQAASAARRLRAQEMAAAGYTRHQVAGTLGVREDGLAKMAKKYGFEFPADKVVGRTRRLNANRIVNETTNAIEGYVEGLDLVKFAELDPNEIEYWVSSLRSSVQSLNRFIKELTQ